MDERARACVVAPGVTSTVELLERRQLLDASLVAEVEDGTSAGNAPGAPVAELPAEINLSDSAVEPDAGAGLEPAAEAAAAAAVPRVVRRYAPLVYLHSAERNLPTSGQWFINRSELRWAKPLASDDSVDETVDASRLGEASADPYTHEYDDRTYSADDYTRPRGDEADRNGLPSGYGFFLDLDNDARGGMRSTSANNRVYRSNARVYYDYRPRSNVTYWFFFAYNDGPGPQNHEGDWERVEVRLNDNNRATHTVYHQHGGSETLTWRRTPRAGSHPIAYSARGSHASYPTAGRHRVFDVTNAGRAWSTWNVLTNVRTRPFYGFGGAWGEVGEISDTTGPLGPSRYK